MDAASNGDSDHSLTWEDFYGSTTDLTPTLIGILNGFLDNPQKEAAAPAEETTNQVNEVKRKMDTIVSSSPSKDPRLLTGSIKLPGLSSEEPTIIKPATSTPSPIKKTPPSKMSYVSRLKSFSLRKNSASDLVLPFNSESAEVISKLNDEVISKVESNRNINTDQEPKPLKVIIPKIPNLALLNRSSYRSKHSIIPLMGATSKITQSSMDIETTTEIYDKPTNPVSNLAKINIPTRSSIRFVSPTQSNLINRVTKDWSPKPLTTFSPESPTKPKTPELALYDTPNSSAAIYDIPNGNRKVSIEESSLPYIDQSGVIEVESKSTPVITVNIENVEASIPYSNGDLKNEDNRLNLPGLNQVIRPLSMSSIASSTSTSSSGNQNKGANSAYLASIESLDDHSDMDAYGQNAKLTQINGSSLTMDSTDGGNGSSKTIESSQQTPPRPLTPPRPRYCDPSLSLLQRVCTEIVDTENVYVEDLRQVVEGYLYFWREEETFATEQLSDLFSNVEEIYKFNKAFSEHLNECNLEAVAIAKCFVHHSSGFGIYTQYCTDYPGIMAALARLMREPDSAQPFRSRQAALGHALPLGSYLLKPVQRILKYHLLLQNLVKQHKSHDTEYALNKMTGIAHDINEMKRRHEHSVRVQEIQSLLYGWNGQDLTTFGELCAEGTFRVFGAKAMRHAFLFDKMLLLTKNKEYGMLAYKSHIMCNNLMLVESIQGQPLSFHVIPFDCPRMQVTLQARSIQHKREWTLLIKRNILENYNAVIPSHARQLVMELGQNKTDDDILAEKSSTLMSHSSMRKQLGAPEYLEKRKLERDRRKSFESGLRYKLRRSATRKEHNYNSAIENDESEKEQNLKDSHSHYVCSDCYNVDRSNLNICEDCDDQFICANCVEDSKDVCKKCKRENENDKENEKRFNLKNKHKCNVEKSQYNCCKCAKPGLPCEKLNDNILLRVDSSREYSSLMSSKELCESCMSSSKSSLNKYSSEKNIYDRINDDNKTLDIKRTCLKCHEIRENIINDDESLTFNSSCVESQKDLNCSMCGRQNFICPSCKVVKVSDNHKDESLHCVNCNCRSPRTKKCEETKSPVIEIKMYNAKTVPKKISKIKKNRAKTLRHITVDSTAKFYTDINDLTSDEVLHISESTDSINNLNENKSEIPADMDEDMYKSLIQKTDSFKKSELEKDKLASQVLKEQEEPCKENDVDDDAFCDDVTVEKPLEQIISQLVMQKREFQKRLKKHSRNTNNRRHQRLIKSHSNPEKVFIQSKDNQFKLKPKFGRQLSAIDSYSLDVADGVEENIEKITDEPIYETLIPNKTTDEKSIENTESDYVYLCFEGRQNIDAYKLPVDLNAFDTGEYAIPNCKPKNIYDDVEIRNPLDVDKLEESESNENYENTSDIWKRISKDTVIENKAFKKAEIDIDDHSDNDGLQSPNLPKIWLNRQKEHFNVPREKKSGSLPRSFQVHNEQNTFLYQNNKPNANKLYLNKDGKVLQTDRPFTIASDHSEICYDDIERFIKINDDSDLKFPQKNQIADSSYSLDEDVEIDSWYKNRFGSEQDNSTMNTSANNSSLEVNKLECETSQEDITQSVHPEHKVYKPTNNLLSFKSVLNRFKSKTKANASEEEVQKKTSPKSGRTILQRLKSMKSEEQSDSIDNINNNPSVLITDTDPIKRTELVISKSFCEDHVSNLNDVELVSKSCNNISLNINGTKPTKVPQSTGIYLSMNKASKSTQELNKYPIYKQGSKLLGARIAQSDYADPKLLMESFSELHKVNMFVNKSALRPDSVLSNSSHFTSSSDGYMTANTEISKVNTNEIKEEVFQIKSDESYYEKSLEEFEKLYNKEEILRDSAIYSDPEDGMSYLNVNDASNVPRPALKKDSISKIRTVNLKTTDTSTTDVKSVISERIVKVTQSKVFKFESSPKIPDINLDKNCNANTITKSKTAPPVPLKPLLNKSFKRSTVSIPCKSNIEIKKPIIIESLNDPSKEEVNCNFTESSPTTPTSPSDKKVGIPRLNFQRAISTTSNINLKRMSFERCSLDSSALNRRLKHSSVSSLELPNNRTDEVVIMKSVQERKKAIEMIENRKSVDSTDSTSVVLSRSYSLKNGSKIQSYSNTKVIQKCNIPVRNNVTESKIVENIPKSGDDVNKNESLVSDDVRNGNDRAGWVKQVVNRFQ